MKAFSEAQHPSSVAQAPRGLGYPRIRLADMCAEVRRHTGLPLEKLERTLEISSASEENRV